MAKIKNPKNLWLFCRVIESLLLIVGGVLAIIYFNNGTLQKITFYLVGSFLIIDATIRIFRYYIEKSSYKIKGKGTLISALELALGLVFVIKPDLLPELINSIAPLLLACFVFTLAAVCLTEGIILILKKSHKIWLIVIYFLVCAIFIAGGVLIIYYNTTSQLVSALFIIVGVFLVLLGVLLLVNGFRPLDKKFDELSNN